jgi:hypothetical protein
MTENEISGRIVDAAMAVHKTLGPGLLESVYEVTLAYELKQRGLRVRRQVPVPIAYGRVPPRKPPTRVALVALCGSAALREIPVWGG